MMDRNDKKVIADLHERMGTGIGPGGVPVDEVGVQPELLAIIKKAELDPGRAGAIIDTLGPFVAEAGRLTAEAATINVTDASQRIAIRRAGEIRKALVKVRTGTDAAHKELKADVLALGRAMDECRRWITDRTKPFELKMAEYESFEERQEQARVAALKAEREAALAPYGVDTRFMLLEKMDAQAFADLLARSKKASEDAVIAKESAEREATAAREREIIARAAAEAETAKVREQAAKDAAAAEVVRRKLEAEGEAARAEAQRIQRQLDETRRAEAQAKQAADAQAKKIADEAAKAEAEKAKIEAARKAAPDITKIREFAQRIRGVECPECATQEGRDLVALALSALIKLAQRVDEAAAKIGGGG